MRRAAVLAAIFVLSAWCLAQTPATAPGEARARVENQEPVSLPRYMTPEEELLPLPPVVRDGRTPPTGAVYCPPEYAPCSGIFMAWEGYTSVLTDMIVPITTLDPSAIVYLVVDTASEQSSAYSSLSAAGADMSQVQFIVCTTDTVWIRDYGPRFIFEDGQRAIIDHTYNRPRPNDDAFNDYLATLWGVPQYDIPLEHGGGNFHLFSNGDAFMTSLILTENPGLTEQQVKNLYAQYQNVNLTIYPGFPTSFDSTQHIDMWMFPTGDNKVIIGQYASSTGQPYTITENAAADLTSRGYTVYRTPGWNPGGTHYTYTNAVVLNNLVVISKFNVSQDAQALATFQAAMPGYTIQQIDSTSIIGAAGAMHCIVMHVPAPMLNMLVTPGSGLQATGPLGGPFTPEAVVYTIDNTSSAPIDYTVGKTASWLTITNGAGSIGAGSSVQVTVAINSTANTLGNGTYADTITFTNQTNHSGDTTRNVSLSVGTPHAICSFPLDANPGWPVSGQWAFGQPTGQGGASHGYPDPASGHTGVNVLGVNLNGDYSTTVGGPYYVTLGPVDLRGVADVELKFERWLNTDYQPYAAAKVEVSTTGTSWQQLWQNGSGTALTDSSWQAVALPAGVADNQRTVWFRWSYQTFNQAYPYSGWNIDDIEIWGRGSVVPPICRGDANCDDGINWRDIDYFVAAMSGEQSWRNMFSPGTPSCPYDNNDLNDDDTVNWRDIDPLVALMNTVCQ